MGDDDLVTEQGIDEGTQDAMTESSGEAEPEDVPDPAGPAGTLPDEPPAAPTGPETSPQQGPGQQLEEGEG